MYTTATKGTRVWCDGIHITPESKETCLLLLGLLMDIREIFKKLFNALNLFHTGEL